MTFTDGEQVTSAIKLCITSEMTKDGLLEDVETFIPSYRLDESMDLPAVWLYEHPTTLKGQMGFGDTLTLTTPFEFVCVEFDDDIEKAEIKGKNLAWRVWKSVFKHKNILLDDKRVFSNIEFNTLYPVGEVQIQGKLNRIPATSVVLDVTYNVQGIVPVAPSEIKDLIIDVNTLVTSEPEYRRNKHY